MGETPTIQAAQAATLYLVIYLPPLQVRKKNVTHNACVHVFCDNPPQEYTSALKKVIATLPLN